MAICVTMPTKNDMVLSHKFGQPKEILYMLNGMRKSGDLTDTVIHVNSTIFHAHRAILACSSEYFRTMFTSNLCESLNGVVHFNNHIDPDIFSLLLDYSYTTEVTVTDKNVEALLEAACHLQYKNVIDVCCNFLTEILHPSNCLGIQQFAESHSLSELHAKAQAYALHHFRDVTQHEEFFKLTLSDLQQYLLCDKLIVDREESTYKAILAWVEHNDCIKQLPALLPCVRLPFTRPDFLLEQLDNPLIMQNTECSKMLRRARSNQLCLREKYLSDSTLVPRYSTKSEVMAIVGGFAQGNQFVRDVFYYNPSTTRWGFLTRIPNLNIYDFAVATLGDCIYINGGKKSQMFSNEMHCYHGDEEKWHQCKNFVTPRNLHSSIGVDGYLYIVGGTNHDGIVDTVERYCPVKDHWEVVTSLPIPVSSSIVISHKQKIYVIGGNLGLDFTYPHMQCYDTVNNAWKTIKTVRIARSTSFPVVILNDMIYFLSGFGKNGMQIYDPELDTLLPPIAMCNYDRHSFEAVAFNGMIYVAGGIANNHIMSSLEVFDPVTSEWRVIGTMPSAMRVSGHGVTIHKYLGPPFSRN